MLLRYYANSRSAILNSDRILTRPAAIFGNVADRNSIDSRERSGPPRSASVLLMERECHGESAWKAHGLMNKVSR
jgi:hypothetical protein